MESPNLDQTPAAKPAEQSDEKPTENASSNTSGKWILFFAKVAISISILGFLFYSAWQQGEWEELRDSPKRWQWVALGVFACLSANLISFYRWQLLVRALDVPFKLVDAVRIGFIGAFFGLIAFGVVAGDSLRAFYATRHVRNRTPEAITSVLVDRLIGLMTMFSIATIAFLLFDPAVLSKEHAQEIRVLELIGWFVVCCTACGYVGMTVLFFTPQLSKTKLFHRIISLPKIGPIIEKLSGAISLYRERLPTVAIAFLLSVGVNLCFVTAIYSLAIGLTENNPSFANHFVIEPIAMVSNAIPLPGGIGGMEFAMQYLYIAFGSSNGVVAGFAMRFSLLLVHAIGGFLWFQNRQQVADIEKQASE